MSLPIKAEINLTNIVNNFNSVKSMLESKVKVCAVVKSNAYGHGLIEVANALYQKADYFAVSLTYEALALRRAGIDKPVLLLTPAFTDCYEPLIKNKVTLTVSSLKELKEIDLVAKKLQTLACVHIKINTGMNRLGLNSLYEVNDIIAYAISSGYIAITGAFTHFGNVLDKRYIKNQYQRFLELTEPIKNYNYGAILHAAASGAILLDDKYHFSMVRPGIMLYGYKPFETDAVSLKPAMSVYARTLLTRKSLYGEKIGYGSKKFKKDGVTLLRLGYADGFRRTTSGFVNDLCMDLSVIDGAIESDYALVMQDAGALAKKYKTIPYEILTSVTKRAEVVYLEN